MCENSLKIIDSELIARFFREKEEKKTQNNSPKEMVKPVNNKHL